MRQAGAYSRFVGVDGDGEREHAVVDDEDAPTLSLAAAQDGLEAASVAVQVLVT